MKTVNISDELHHELKVIAIMQNIDLKDLISDVMWDYVKRIEDVSKKMTKSNKCSIIK